MIFSFKDATKASLEAASGGSNTLIFDKAGNGSYMVGIPRYNLSQIDSSWPDTPHPAFIVNGVVKDVIWISKYQNIVKDGYACSLPGQDPATYITFDQARAACEKKGKGWHLMNNAEWAAIALWCWKNGFQPHGNNNHGSDITYPWEHGVPASMDGSQVGRTLTGSGPATWYHDGTEFGIADMNGNVWEWNDGMKLIDGKIYVFGDNSSKTPMNNYTTQNNSHDVTGWYDTGYYYDSVAAGSSSTSSADLGAAMLNTTRSHPAYTGASTDEYYAYNSMTFESMGCASGVTAPNFLKYLCLYPPETGLNGDYFWVRNYGESLPIYGADDAVNAGSGVYAYALNEKRGESDTVVGFRASFIA